MIRGARTYVCFACVLFSNVVTGFSPTALSSSSSASRRVSARRLMMEMEEIEFIIHADGRVEEKVRGVKGVSCEAVTSEINKALGEVYESKPTAEMFEQKIELSVDAENTVSESSWGQSGESGGGSYW